MPITAQDLWVVAQTLWGEARGEGVDGLYAVGHVIHNRARDHRWSGLPLAAICQQPYQFSCWLTADPNRYKLDQVSLTDPVFAAALHAAVAVFSGSHVPDPTQGATHYCATSMTPPAWAHGHEPCACIGHHRFYKGIA
jgi:N-acetylmuramoyl-L-alanine amidase